MSRFSASTAGRSGRPAWICPAIASTRAMSAARNGCHSADDVTSITGIRSGDVLSSVSRAARRPEAGVSAR